MAIRKPASGAMASIVEQGQENVAALEATFTPAPVTEVATDYLKENANNPRRRISETSVAEMANGIRQAGGEILQPLLVRPIAPDPEGRRYEVVCGNRRLRAARSLGMPKVPVRVREMDDEEAARFALWENLSREDLNAIDMAESINQLRQIERLSWEQISERFGFSRQWGWKQQKLAELPDEIREMVRDGSLSPSKAMLLWQIEGGVETAISLARRAVSEKLSHRALLSEIALRRKHVLTSPDIEGAEAARKHVLTWAVPPGFQKRRYNRLVQATETLVSTVNEGSLTNDYALSLRPLAERILELAGFGTGSGSLPPEPDDEDDSDEAPPGRNGHKPKNELPAT